MSHHASGRRCFRITLGVTGGACVAALVTAALLGAARGDAASASPSACAADAARSGRTVSRTRASRSRSAAPWSTRWASSCRSACTPAWPPPAAPPCRRRPTSRRLWWAGFALISGAELLTGIAFGLAPAGVVSALGAVTLVSNAGLAYVYLGERLTRVQGAGVALVLGGSVLLGVATPPTSKTFDGARAARPLRGRRRRRLRGHQPLRDRAAELGRVAVVRGHRARRAHRERAGGAGAPHRERELRTVVAVRGASSLLANAWADCAACACRHTLASPLLWVLAAVVLSTAFVAGGLLEQRGIALFAQTRWVPVHYCSCAILFGASSVLVYRDTRTSTRRRSRASWAASCAPSRASRRSCASTRPPRPARRPPARFPPPRPRRPRASASRGAPARRACEAPATAWTKSARARRRGGGDDEGAAEERAPRTQRSPRRRAGRGAPALDGIARHRTARRRERLASRSGRRGGGARAPAAPGRLRRAPARRAAPRRLGCAPRACCPRACTAT